MSCSSRFGSAVGGGAASAASIPQRTGPPVAFVIHRILRLLEASKGVVRLSQLENQLIKDFQNLQGFNTYQFDLRGDAELMRALETNERIHFDKFRNELSYVNPFEYVTSEAVLLHRIRYNNNAGGGSSAGSTVSLSLSDGGGGANNASSTVGMGGLYGLKVSKDLLSGNGEIKTFIRNLLSERKVRCVRPAYVKEAKVKCLYANSTVPQQGAGQTDAALSAAAAGSCCSVYAKKKCSECYEGLRGLFLYTLGDVEAEEAREKLDNDIREIWTSIPLPSIDQILLDQNVRQQKRMKWINPTAEEKKTLVMLKRKKRRMEQKQMLNGIAGGAGTKLRKIQNTHLFTADQMRLEILQQQ